MNPLDEVRAEFPLTVLKQRPVVDEQRRLERFFARQPDGLRLVMILVDEQARADNRFFRRYRGYVLKPFSVWSGYTPDEAHEVLIELHSTYDYKLPNGTVIKRQLRTHSMTDEQFADYIRRCEVWLIEQGCMLPERRERVA